MGWLSLLGGAGSMLSGLTKGVSKFGGGAPRRYHRKRRKLSQAQISELTMLANTFGKTAVAKILPIYLGGR